jgi:hypothetical protein
MFFLSFLIDTQGVAKICFSQTTNTKNACADDDATTASISRVNDVESTPVAPLNSPAAASPSQDLDEFTLTAVEDTVMHINDDVRISYRDTKDEFNSPTELSSTSLSPASSDTLLQPHRFPCKRAPNEPGQFVEVGRERCAACRAVQQRKTHGRLVAFVSRVAWGPKREED